MEFEYGYEMKAGNVFEVDDAFNTQIKLTDYQGEEYYLITRTKHGYTSYLFIGPIPIEGQYLGKYSSVIYKKSASSRPKIKSEISNFINDQRKAIQAVEEIPMEDVISKCSKWNLLEYMGRDEL